MMYPYNRRRGRYRGRGVTANAGGYKFFDSGDKQGGAWTRSMQVAEAARVKAQQQS